MSAPAIEPSRATPPFTWREWLALFLICSVSACLNLSGNRTGLPSQERLQISLGGAEAVDRAGAEIKNVLNSHVADRSDFMERHAKPELARLSPYFDQVRSYHPDEQYILKVLARMVRDRDPDPKSYIYGPFFFYQIGAGLAVGKLVGVLPAKTDVLYYIHHPDEFAPMYLNARFVCAAFGVGVVAVTFLIGLRVGKLALASVASLLLACVPLLTLASKFIKPDTPTVFWSTLALWFALPVASRGRWCDYILSGVCAGLASGSKYPAILSSAYLATFHILRRWPQRKETGLLCRQDWLLIAGGAAAILSFVVTNPACVLNAKLFWHDVEFISNVLNDRSILAALWDGVVCYGQDAFFYTMGAAASLAMLAGVVGAIVRPSRMWTSMLPTIALFVLFACRGRAGSDAYLLPAFPALALLAARAIMAIRWQAVRWSVAALVIAITLSYSLAYNRVARSENARLRAAHWMNEHVPPGATIGSFKYPVGYRVPMVSPERYRLLSLDFDPAAATADYFIDSSFEWAGAHWQDRLAARAVTNQPPSQNYRAVAVFEDVPRAWFGLVSLRRDHMLTPYIEVIAPRVTIYRREGH